MWNRILRNRVFQKNSVSTLKSLFYCLIVLLFMAGCGSSPATESENSTQSAGGELLRVVASTSIIADVVAQVGGDSIELTALMPAGTDPHSFEPTPQDLIFLSKAQVTFINGLHLDESVEAIFEAGDGVGQLVVVNDGVETRAWDEEGDVHEEHEDEEHEDEEHEDEEHHDEEHADEEHDEHQHDHGEIDPHTWFSIQAVIQWVENIEESLKALDPENAQIYEANAASYRTELEGLEQELETLLSPLAVEKRRFVTDHDALGYFAAAYGFEIVGSVLPSLSTMASPTAGQLAELQIQIGAENVQAIFVGVSVNSDLATQIATESGIEVVPIYTDSLSAEDGPAGSYVEFMRHNIMMIVDALK